MSVRKAAMKLVNGKPRLEPEFRVMAPEYEDAFAHMHTRPGLAFAEETEKQTVMAKLDQLGLGYNEVGGGIVATIEGRVNTSGRVVSLSAEMDALPVQESAEQRKPAVSQVAGVAHACGHDGHTASLLMSADYLRRHRRFNGAVLLIWRPAEETGQGARAMLDAGLLERFPFHELYGYHNFPDYPLGFGAVSAGPVLCGAQDFKITIAGRGGHAGHGDVRRADQASYKLAGYLQAQWQMARDGRLPFLHTGEPIRQGKTLMGLSGLSSNSMAANILADRAQCFGTIRALNHRDINAALQGLRRAWDQENPMDAGSFTLEKTGDYLPPLVNAPVQTDAARRAMQSVLGRFFKVHAMPPVTGTDDFALLAEKVPACYFALMGGENDPTHPHSQKLHSAGYIYNKALLPVAANILVNIVEDRLAL